MADQRMVRGALWAAFRFGYEIGREVGRMVGDDRIPASVAAFLNDSQNGEV